MTSACSCEWKGRWHAPYGWDERIVKRDPECSIHGDAEYDGTGPEKRYLDAQRAAATGEAEHHGQDADA